MDLMLLVSCTMIGLAVSLFVYTMLSRNSAGVLSAAPEGPEARVAVTPGGGDPDSHASNLHEVLLQRSRSERVVKPWLNRLKGLPVGATPRRRIEMLHEHATTAGLQRTWSPQRIAAVRTLLLVSGCGVGALAWLLIGGRNGAASAIILAGIGWRGLDVYLVNRARTRQEEITTDLPDVADQISISVLAGLGFEQAIRRTVDSTEGALSEELARFLHDTRVGVPRQVAFKNLQERVDVADFTSFVRAIAQAERTGVSIADILQIQADELRERRKQRAEERAMKIPVLMLMPLVTCILPPLLIVLMGPAALNFLDSGFG